MRAGGYVAVAIGWLGVVAPAWGWGAPEWIVRGNVGCLSAPSGGGGVATWAASYRVWLADLSTRRAPRELGNESCATLSADGSVAVATSPAITVIEPRTGDSTALAAAAPMSTRVATGGGTVTVAWIEYPDGETARVVTAARDPGGRFDRGQELASAPYDGTVGPVPDLDVGVDAAGVTTALWGLPTGVAFARREPGGAFAGRAEVLDPEPADAVALAVSGDGRALAAWALLGTPDGGRVHAAVAASGRDYDTKVEFEGGVIAPVAVAGPEGTLLLAWQAEHSIWIWTGGGAPQRVASAPSVDKLSVAIAPDGRVLLAWSATGKELAAAIGRPGGHFAVSRHLGSPCREERDPAAFFDSAGRGAIAFLSVRVIDYFSSESDGIGVIREGPAAPARRPPRTTMRIRREGRVIRLRVECAGGCDVHTRLRHGNGFSAAADGRRDFVFSGNAYADRVKVTACGDDGGVVRRTLRIPR